ncbi:MAG: TldD/PmbA family protein, partial [Bdellovibrionales bacterium]|nr:TldD/PmbA family protein [Bdellovibrionales bacterium]
LVAKVKEEPSQGSRPYHPPTWKQRLEGHLDPLITEQVPEGVTSDTWVHFSNIVREQMFPSNREAMKFAKTQYERLMAYKNSLEENHLAKSPDYQMLLLSLQRDDFLYMDSEARMSQSLLRNRIVAAVLKGGDQSYHLGGGVGGLETLQLQDDDIDKVFGDLESMLKAEKLKPGRYKVLMAPAITGVFAHEAFGHSQEADTWARNRSKARELYESQEKVGNEHATILNNPAIYKNGTDDFAAWGSYFFDEEGWLAQEQYLVKEGRLQPPMTNLTSALRLGVPRTANGKRESWSHAIYSRQTNTYFSAGTSTFKELMEQMDYGFLARNCNGGMEDPKGMGIQVGMAFIEEVKNGQLTGRTFKAPNGGAVQLTGYVPDYLNSILGKSKIEAFSDQPDKEQHPWNEVGGCGKYHKELVNAGCGGTYILVDNCLLG